ncbi:hypothetical protein A3SI_09722 [Nitritalea halalkaliphila LW7]|uniref:SIMPL domain-containing protein n=1 Tax=Nitritalea halalkaliphila LW7 TaxID=1189621 RepID=I5C3R6_9BACT|nr:hypothetical protein [Nitritalea halalkaliphila]EIM76468.1 hypothetical protein A3SI_09722 [Nitritalea halalkaliphila LW7]
MHKTPFLLFALLLSFYLGSACSSSSENTRTLSVLAAAEETLAGFPLAVSVNINGKHAQREQINQILQSEPLQRFSPLLTFENMYQEGEEGARQLVLSLSYRFLVEDMGDIEQITKALEAAEGLTTYVNSSGVFVPAEARAELQERLFLEAVQKGEAQIARLAEGQNLRYRILSTEEIEDSFQGNGFSIEGITYSGKTQARVKVTAALY